MNNNLKSVQLSEDEWNNLLIDMWVVMNKEIKAEPSMYEVFDALTGKVALSPESVTVTLTLKDSHYGK